MPSQFQTPLLPKALVRSVPILPPATPSVDTLLTNFDSIIGSNQVMVIVSVVVSPETPEETMPCPALSTHTFILSQDLMDNSETVFYISHHIYR